MNYKYDAFLSHNRKDKPIVRQIARNLRGAGLRIFYDEDDVPPGADIAATIEWAVDKSKHVLLFLSNESMASRWVAMETALTLYRDPDARDGVLIPITLETLDTSTIRPAVRRLNIIDLFGSADERTRNYGRILSCLGVDGRFSTMMDWGFTEDTESSTNLAPRIVHELPPAPRFVGRKNELGRLDEFWSRPDGGVLTLVGIGGCGKTALLGEFLRRVRSSQTPPTALFVWSFYDEADPNAFLASVYEYFTSKKRDDVKGLGWLLILRETLVRGERNLLVLDGLEKVQRLRDRRAGDKHVFGELEDALLREFLKRVASGAGKTKAIITTRFPVVDLDRWENRGVTNVHLDELDLESCESLLTAHGVRGTDRELAELSERYGRHALTLDHLGSLLRRFFSGDPKHAPELSPVELHGRDPQAHRLRRVLQAYERSLPENELLTLCRLCLFQYPVTIELYLDVFGFRAGSESGQRCTSPLEANVLRDCMDSLVTDHLVLRDCNGQLTVHPAVRDHFYQLNKDASGLHRSISTSLTRLADRPGADLPSDYTSLTLLENLIHHLVQAGDLKKAVDVYERRLGAMYHLSSIGEHARGLRVLRMFPSVIDWDGYLRFRRGVGDVPSIFEWEGASERLSFYSANGKDAAMLLLGELDASQTTAARYLMGQSTHVLYSDDFAPRFSAILLQKIAALPKTRLHRPLPTKDKGRASVGEVDHAHSRDRTDDLDMRSGGNSAIESLWDAEEFRLTGDYTAASASLDRASRWILRASSAEHLLAYHLARSRLATDKGLRAEASATLQDATTLARRFSMGVLHVDLLLERTRTAFLHGELELARNTSHEASELARGLGSGYIWAIRASELFNLLMSRKDATNPHDYLGDLSTWQEKVKELPEPVGLVVYLGELFYRYYENRTTP